MSNLFFIVFAIFLLLSSFQCPLECPGHSKPNKKAQLSLPRKEVIHPHVLVGIPCYDLTPITSPTLGAALLTVRLTTSSITGSHGVTGSVYNARERIHRSVADLRLLATPPSWCRVADTNPN